MSEQTIPDKIRIQLIGNYDCGKTILIYRFISHTYLQIMMANIDQLIFPHIRICDGYILCFAIDDPNTFVEIDTAYDEIMSVKGPKQPPMILVGAKSDLFDATDPNRFVTEEQSDRLAEKLGCEYFEVSALTNTNVNQAFQFIVQKTFQAIKSLRQKEQEQKTLHKNPKKETIDHEVCLI